MNHAIKRLIRELRLCIMVILVQLALDIMPKDCKKTARWFMEMPFED